MAYNNKVNAIQKVTPTQQNSVVTLPNIEKLTAEWLKFVDAKSDKTTQTYNRAIRQFLQWLNDNEISQPTRDDILAYRDYLVCHTDNKGNTITHKPNTINSYLAAVRSLFQFLEVQGYYKNVYIKINGAAHRSGTHEKEAIRATQAKQLLDSIDRNTQKGARDYAIIALMLTTGLRTISIINADIQDIVLHNDIKNDISYYALKYKAKGHGEKDLMVKLAAPVKEAIDFYLSTRPDARPDAPLFASNAQRNNGQRMTTRSISRIVKEQLKTIGIDSDQVTAHSLRHTAAVLNLVNNPSKNALAETQLLLGHKNIETTMIYAHLLDRDKNNSEYIIANAIFN